MSFFVLAIAAAHSLPPILGAAIGKSKFSVKAGGAVGVVVAIAFGSIDYLIFDLMGVAVGTLIGFSLIKSDQTSE